jgi:hypothetical protein
LFDDVSADLMLSGLATVAAKLARVSLPDIILFNTCKSKPTILILQNTILHKR